MCSKLASCPPRTIKGSSLRRLMGRFAWLRSQRRARQRPVGWGPSTGGARTSWQSSPAAPTASSAAARMGRSVPPCCLVARFSTTSAAATRAGERRCGYIWWLSTPACVEFHNPVHTQSRAHTIPCTHNPVQVRHFDLREPAAGHRRLLVCTSTGVSVPRLRGVSPSARRRPAYSVPASQLTVCLPACRVTQWSSTASTGIPRALSSAWAAATPTAGEWPSGGGQSSPRLAPALGSQAPACPNPNPGGPPCRVFDIRRPQGGHLSVAEPVRRLCPDDLRMRRSSRWGVTHITCAVYSEHSSYADLLVTYNDANL